MSSQSITLKFNQVNIQEITCENVKMGSDSVPLLRYGPSKQTLNIQGPWIKMKQFGIPPGPVLSNGADNKFYLNEDSRLNVRFPINEDCHVNIDDTKTNIDEIKEYIVFLKELDKYIKTNTTFMKLSSIDPDDMDKYTAIYRKPVKSKTSNVEKYYSLKAKLHTIGTYGKNVQTESKETDKKIITEFYELDNETNKYVLINGVNKQITLDVLEKSLKFNCEILPILQLVKVWTQSNGTWGVTLKLVKARIKNTAYSEKGSAEFLDSDDETTPTKPTKPTAPSKTIITAAESESESDEEPTTKPPDKNQSSAIKQVDSDSESDGSDEETDKPQVKPPVVECSDSESDSDEDPAMPTQSPVVECSDSESDSDEDMPTPPPVSAKKSKTKAIKAEPEDEPKAKTVKKASTKAKK